MRAAVLERPAPAGDGPLVLATRPDPAPAPGELLLRVDACAVCRTDLQICEGDIEARRLPVVPGHQAVGTVEALGDGVEGWRIGDRAGVAWLAGACGACPRCDAGRENLCESAQFTGWDRDGGYAERLTVRAAYAHPLPAALDPVEAAPLLCGGIIGYRALRLSGIEPGGRLGLYGFGASARLALQVATHWGCEVFVATLPPRPAARPRPRRRLGRRHARPPARPPRRCRHLRPRRRGRRRRPQGRRPGRDRGRQRHPPRPHPRVPLRAPLVGTQPPQRRQLHPPGRPRVPRPRRRYPHPHRDRGLPPRQDANRALADLASGKVEGAAVLRID